MLEKIKFEYVFAIAIMLIVNIFAGIAFFQFSNDVAEKIIIPVITADISALSAITAYFFTKTIPQ